VDAESIASAHVRTVEHLDWPSWCARVNDLLAKLHALFWPDLFIFGGSISEDFDQYGHLLRSPAEIRRAVFGAQAGAVGAALAAATGKQP
jgi:polyphosphate glucokinase